ncbi:MAG: hypothetical protein KDN19_05000 [Verrucomicrobiae bacterium]|nr:hypothetical protein [Verrucomicrobiae bacterium]
MDFIIQDIKTDRPNISGGLPNFYRLIPVGFYFVAIFAIGLNIYFYSALRGHQRDEKTWQSEVTRAMAEQTAIMDKQGKINSEAQAAERIADWVDGARPVQPITVTITRSMEANATIAELNMDRNPAMPAHLFMTLKINHAGSEQLESTLDALSAIDYQTYSAQQVKAENAIDFQATLIWNKAQ